MRGVDGLVLATQQRRNLGGKPAEHHVLGIDNVPGAVHLAGLRLYVRTDLPRRHSLYARPCVGRRSSWGVVAAGARQRGLELLEHARQLASRRITAQQQKKIPVSTREGQNGWSERVRGPQDGSSRGPRAPLTGVMEVSAPELLGRALGALVAVAGLTHGHADRLEGLLEVLGRRVPVALRVLVGLGRVAGPVRDDRSDLALQRVEVAANGVSRVGDVLRRLLDLGEVTLISLLTVFSPE